MLMEPTENVKFSLRIPFNHSYGPSFLIDIKKQDCIEQAAKKREVLANRLPYNDPEERLASRMQAFLPC
jgi:hypothetical protein